MAISKSEIGDTKEKINHVFTYVGKTVATYATV